MIPLLHVLVALAVVGMLTTEKALHGAAAPAMDRTANSAQVRALSGLRSMGMVSATQCDGTRQEGLVTSVASIHARVVPCLSSAARSVGAFRSDTDVVETIS